MTVRSWSLAAALGVGLVAGAWVLRERPWWIRHDLPARLPDPSQLRFISKDDYIAGHGARPWRRGTARARAIARRINREHQNRGRPPGPGHSVD